MGAMVTYRLDGQEYGNLAADVSPDGIFIRTFVPPPVGTRLELTVELPKEMGGYCVDLEGEVVRVVESEEDPRQNGMGVHFTAIHASDPETVRHLVARIFRYDVLRRSHETLEKEE
jgi:Tfp pilus assembly protein PilZ